MFKKFDNFVKQNFGWQLQLKFFFMLKKKNHFFCKKSRSVPQSFFRIVFFKVLIWPQKAPSLMGGYPLWGVDLTQKIFDSRRTSQWGGGERFGLASTPLPQ